MTAVDDTTAGPAADAAAHPGTTPADADRLADAHERHDGPRSAFEPLGIVPRYPPPRATIDPDGSKGWLRRVLPVVLARRWALIGSMLLAGIAMLAQLAVPAVLSRAIDEALVDRAQPLMPFVWVIIGLAAVRAVCAFGYRYGLYGLAFHIETDLRSVLYRHLTRLSFPFYDRVQSGQIISRANADIRSVQMFLAFAPLISISILSFGVALVFMLTIDVPLTLLAVLPLPLVYVLGVSLRNRIFPLSWISQARQAELATIVDENVNGVRVVRSFAAEQRQLDLLARAATRLRWANVETVAARGRWAPFMENLPRLGQVIVLGYGGWLVIDDQVQLGVLVAFNAYIVMMQVPFRMLGFFLMLQQRAAASAGRIYELLDEPVDVVERPGAPDLVDPAGRVELDHVRFGYGPAEGEGAGPDVLVDVSLTVDPGETVALVGATGSGKSTVARLLPRFYDVRDGAVRIDGHDVRDVTLTSLRAAVGVVLDEPFLFSATVRENIAYGRPDASMVEVRAAARAAAAERFVEELEDGFETVVGERGYTLSGGQRQRLAIARTLLVNPPVLVLDDATSAIDVKVESEIHDALRTLLAGRTTIIIAHRLSTISLADRVVLLEGGRVVAEGPHAELLATEPRYREVLAHAEDEERAVEGHGDGLAGHVDDTGAPVATAGGGLAPDEGHEPSAGGASR